MRASRSEEQLRIVHRCLATEKDIHMTAHIMIPMMSLQDLGIKSGGSTALEAVLLLHDLPAPIRSKRLTTCSITKRNFQSDQVRRESWRFSGVNIGAIF